MKKSLIKPQDIMVAIDHMRVLNVYAKQIEKCPVKRFIYDLKDGMTEYLYKHRYAVAVNCFNQDIQQLSGSGVYRSNKYYVYTFEVDEYRFSWHQPVEDAITKPKLFGDIEQYSKENSIVTFGDINERLRVVWEFLHLNQVQISPFIGDMDKQRIIPRSKRARLKYKELQQ